MFGKLLSNAIMKLECLLGKREVVPLRSTGPEEGPIRPLGSAKPAVGSYSFHNSASQGTLICQTAGWPDSINIEEEEYFGAYSDRISAHAPLHYQEAVKIAGCGDQHWATVLWLMPDDKLKEFAKAALGLNCIPKHVRAVYFFNAGDGFNCPLIEAISATREAEA